MELQAKAQVQVTVDVILGDRWGEECPESALLTLAAALKCVRIVGEPKIVGIITERAR